jgi:hypothetical protein
MPTVSTDISTTLDDRLSTPYGVADFERDMTSVKPRFVDIWVIPPMMIWLGLRAKALHRWPRRMLFTAGAYMLMRNYAGYKQSMVALSEMALHKEA